MDKIFKVLPFLLMGMGLYSTYTDYEEHLVKLESLQGQIDSKTVQNARLKKKVDAIKDFIPQIDSVNKKISDFENQIKEIKLKIPPLDNKTDILDELSVEAKKLNIQKISFKPKEEKIEGGGLYFVNSLEFEAVGTYLQFLIFFEKLSIAERVFNVSSIEIEDSVEKPTGRHKLITANAIIETYHYNDNFKEPTKEEGVKKKR